jgi:hypothetical protein
MAAPTVTIAGAAKDLTQRGRLAITEAVNARNTCRATVTSLDGTYRPAIDAEVLVAEGATRIFGGVIIDLQEKGFGSTGASAAIDVEFTASDFSIYADRRVASVYWEAGTRTLKQAFTFLVSTYLSGFGISVDGAQVDGPTLATSLHYVEQTVKSIFDDLAARTGYVWEIDYTKTGRMVLPASNPAPFSLVVGGQYALGDIVVATTRERYYNALILHCGSNAGVDQMDRADTWGDANRITSGGRTVYRTTYSMAGFAGPFDAMTDDSVPQAVGAWGSGAAWLADRYGDALGDGLSALVHDDSQGGVPSGVIAWTYRGDVPFTVYYEDAAEIAARGRWEAVLEAGDITDYASGHERASALTTAAIASSVKTVRYRSREAGLHPGQLQTITLPKRALSGSHLLTQVQRTWSHGGWGETTVTAVSGSTDPGAWGDLFQRSAGSASVGATGVGALTSTTINRPHYHLGGSESEWVEAGSAVWRPATPIVLSIDTIERGTVYATLRVRLRASAAGVSTQARLYNVTDASVVGTTEVVTSDTWVDAAPVVCELAAGRKQYRLEVLRSTSADVAAVGGLE